MRWLSLVLLAGCPGSTEDPDDTAEDVPLHDCGDAEDTCCNPPDNGIYGCLFEGGEGSLTGTVALWASGSETLETTDGSYPLTLSGQVGVLPNLGTAGELTITQVGTCTDGREATLIVEDAEGLLVMFGAVPTTGGGWTVAMGGEGDDCAAREAGDTCAPYPTNHPVTFTNGDTQQVGWPGENWSVGAWTLRTLRAQTTTGGSCDDPPLDPDLNFVVARAD